MMKYYFLGKSIFCRLTSVSLLVLSLFVFGNVAFSQFPANDLSVEVKDTNGGIIAGAKVDLSIAGLTVRTGVTNESGTLRIANIKTGAYKIAVTADGFSNVIRDLSVNSPSPAAIEIVLAAGGIKEDVTVQRHGRRSRRTKPRCR